MDARRRMIVRSCICKPKEIRQSKQEYQEFELGDVRTAEKKRPTKLKSLIVEKALFKKHQNVVIGKISSLHEAPEFCPRIEGEKFKIQRKANRIGGVFFFPRLT